MPWFLVLLRMGSVMVFVACASTGAHGNYAVTSQTAFPWPPGDGWPRLSPDIVVGELVPLLRAELLPRPPTPALRRDGPTRHRRHSPR